MERRMKLELARVENYRSVEHSGDFVVADVTCLVGKNEAGKTAILHALQQVRPYDSAERSYDRIVDYPRRHLASYATRHPNGEAIVCWTKWRLTPQEKLLIEAEFGSNVMTSEFVETTKSYEQTNTTWSVLIDEESAVKFLIDKHRLDEVDAAPLAGLAAVKDLHQALAGLPAPTDRQAALLSEVNSFRDQSIFLRIVDILEPLTPKFKLFSHFDRMSGELSINKVARDRENNVILTRGDNIFLQFLEYAGTRLEELTQADRYEALKANCEAASARLTDQIFEYWSQNTALEVEVDVSEGRTADPPPFNTGTVVRARVKNTMHRASVPFSERSAGFVWFFSFLVEFAQIKKDMGNVIVLLDEPGLTLHGKAQRDLLRYIYEKVAPHHQVVFTTHSTFMVPTDDITSVRIVEDVVRHDPNGKARLEGTKVSTDVLAVDKNTLFPLQGALGYDIAQSLFVGEHTLLVEGPSDILYFKAMSAALGRAGKIQLDARWVLCPAGGIDKVQPFVSLFGGNNLHIAAITDHGPSDARKIDAIKKSDVLRAGHFYSTNDFVGQDHSDVEDFFGRGGYLEIVNGAYGLTGEHALDEASLSRAAPQSPRVLKLVEGAFRLLPPEAPEFDHFTPAAWLIERPKIADALLRKHPNIGPIFEAVFRTFNGLLP
jgi:predicted ATPase